MDEQRERQFLDALRSIRSTLERLSEAVESLANTAIAFKVMADSDYEEHLLKQIEERYYSERQT
jgi:hypothetical protein